MPELQTRERTKPIKRHPRLHRRPVRIAPPNRLTEEKANQLTHALGLVLSIAGTIWLLMHAKACGRMELFVGCSIYGATLVALYTASTLSHSFEQQRWRDFFRMMDQACIFLLIAGSFTPFAVTYFREGWLFRLSIAFWGLALAGIVFKLCFRRLNNVATSSYVLLGWMPFVAIKPLAELMPGRGLTWVLAGGLFYTAGTYFLINDTKVRYFHMVWHLFVIAGSVSHFIAVMYYVLPAA